MKTVDLLFFITESRSKETRDSVVRFRSSLEETGAVIVRDPRLESIDNDFRDLMVQYFQQDSADKRRDEVANHQVGWTPEFVEKPDDFSAWVETLDPDQRPFPATDSKDPKERFFIPVGGRPTKTAFPDCYADPIWPSSLPELPRVAEAWGGSMLQTIATAMEMLAKGYNLPRDTFTDLMANAPHLLAPTGSDLSKYGQEGRVLAGVHKDLNLVTGHGKANYPGLFLWTTEGKRIPARVPDGCILLQAGKQLEIATGGRIRAGMHQVVVTPEVHTCVGLQNLAMARPWRVTTTLFAHWALDRMLEPLALFRTAAAVERYPAMLAGEYLHRELTARALQ